MDVLYWALPPACSVAAFVGGWWLGVRARRRNDAEAHYHLHPEDEWMR